MAMTASPSPNSQIHGTTGFSSPSNASSTPTKQGATSTQPMSLQSPKKEQGKGKDGERETNAVPTPAPAWSELKTKAGKERKRLPLACKSCRRKKVRCSGETPSCKHCSRAKIPCVYKVTQRKATPRTDYMTMLDKRLKRMEERVIKLVPPTDSAKVAAIGRASVKPPATDSTGKKVGTKKRAAIEAFASDHEDMKAVASNPKDLSETCSLMEGKEYLPPQEIQEHLAETYFDSCYGQPYHLLHKPSFMRRLREGSLPAVLMLAVCCVSARFSNHPHFANDPPTMRGDQWASEARRIASRSFIEPNLTTIIVVTLLALYDFGSCQGGRAWMHSGIAMRMCYALQLNQEYEIDSSGVVQAKETLDKGKDKGTIKSADNGMGFTDQEIRRRTMWSCYLMDCFNSSGTKRPIFDHIQHLKIQLPIKEAYFQLEIPGQTEDIHGEPGTAPLPNEEGDNKTPRENMGVAAYLIKTLALWAKIVHFSNTMRMSTDSNPPWHSESEFTKIAAQVRNFGQTIPNFLRYTPENLRSHEADRLGSQFAFMHIIYQQITLFLHKFAIPVFPGSKIPPEMPKDFLGKTRRAAVEAACKVSKILEDAKGLSLNAPFASYCTFASSTVHIWGMFSKDARLSEMCKGNLAINMRYLSRMKKYWSMVHYFTESLKDIYRQHHDAHKNSATHSVRKASDEVFFTYGDLQDVEQRADSPEETGPKQPQSPNSKSRNAELSSKTKLLSVNDWYQSKGHSPQLNSADIPNRAAKRGKQRHGTPSSPADHSTPRFDTASMVSHTPTPPDTTGVGMSTTSNPRSTPQPLPQSAASRFAAVSNPYQDHNLAASFTMASLMSNPNSHLGRLPVQSFDRQLVYGAYAQDPSLPMPAAFETSAFDANPEGDIPSFGLMNGALDPGFASQMGMDATSASGVGMGTTGGFGDASAAWLTPFHLVPPVNLVQPEFNSSSMGGNQGDDGIFSMGSDGSGMMMDFLNT